MFVERGLVLGFHKGFSFRSIGHLSAKVTGKSVPKRNKTETTHLSIPDKPKKGPTRNATSSSKIEKEPSTIANNSQTLEPYGHTTKMYVVVV